MKSNYCAQASPAKVSRR